MINNKTEDLLQQIAVDVAVIKSELAAMKPLKEEVTKNREELVVLKSQLQLFRWLGCTVSTGFLGIFIKIFHDRLI